MKTAPVKRTPVKRTPSLAGRLRERLRARTARVAVMGLGYVGLPLAETFASAGFAVLGYDVDPAKVAKLNRGLSYIGHIASERVAELIETRRFEATSNAEQLCDVDAVVICVPTPLTDARQPDLSHIVNTGHTLKTHLQRGQLIVLESTTYPGTTVELLQPLLEESGLRGERDFFLAYSPEREDPGNPDFSTRTIPKVVGGINAVSRQLAVDLYEPVAGGIVPVKSTQVAEAAKILENTYRAVNIALVNEMKVVFEAMGIDIWEVIAAARTKPFGFQAFAPGPGLGGHCIPIDPFYLAWAARRHGVATRFIELAGEINTSMPAYVVERVAAALNEHAKPIKGSRVAILGVAYKKDVDDPHEAPAFPILEMLQQRGALASYNDPHIPQLPAMRHHQIRLAGCALTEAYLAEQDCVVIVTDHSAYDYDFIVRHSKLIVDTRNATAGCVARGATIWKA